jgi:predicted sulfurtransferase
MTEFGNFHEPNVSSNTFKPLNHEQFMKCQSCGTPHCNNGTNKDGTLSSEYCSDCFQNGKFTEPRLSVTEMQKKMRNKHEQIKVQKFISDFWIKEISKLKRWKG